MWSKISNSRVFYAVLAFLCAIAGWLYVETVQAPNTSTTLNNFPVTFIGEDALAEQGLMITEGKDTTVNLTLTGTRSVLSQLSRNNITITVQAASQISGAGTYSLEYYVSFPSSTDSKVTVKNSSMSRIDVTVVQMASATVDIIGSFEGTVVEGALIDESSFVFESAQVTVSGESSLVEQVDHASVVLSETDLDDTWSGELDIVLVDAQGEPVDTTNLSCSIDSVYTTFPISFVKEVPLTVNFLEGGGASADNASYSFNTNDTVTISGTQDVLDEIDSISIGTIDLSQVITSEVLTFTIPVPDGITIISGLTTASVTVTITGLTTRVVEVSDIRFTNVPEGLEATSLTQSVSVRIRATEDVMSLVMDTDVMLIVDLSDMDTSNIGTYYKAATVSVTGFADVGAVNDYQVVVSLSEAVETTEEAAED